MKYIFLTIIVSLFVTTSQAHHGWSGYKKQVRLTVTIKQVRFGNPHDRLIVTDAEGQDWNMLLAPRSRNQKFGFGPEIVSSGDVVTLFGQKHKSKAEIKTHCIYKDGEAIYTYYYNNGKTSLQRERIGKKC